MKKLLIFEINNILISRLLKLKFLGHEDFSTGGVYGFIQKFTSVVAQHKPSHILFCDDSPPYERFKYYKEYKQDRAVLKNSSNKEFYLEKTFKEAYRDNKFALEEILHALGFDIWKIKGLEADDLIASCVLEEFNNFDEIDIVVKDSDLFPFLLLPNVFLIRDCVKFGIEEYKRAYNYLKLEDWEFCNALAGTHNNVKGIDRVGLKTAAKFLEHCRANNLDVIEELKLKGWYDTYALNSKLLSLPFILYNGTINKAPLKQFKLDIRKLTVFLSIYGIQYSSQMEEAFEYCRFY